MNGAVRASVVVGVDGSPESKAAVDVAAREAQWRDLPLRLVHGYQPPVVYGPSAFLVYDAATPLRYARSLPGAEAERIRQRYPELRMSTATVVGDPGTVLVDESREAALLVVGSRGSGSFRSLLLGSVSAHVAAHAPVPVIVVRPPATDPTEGRRSGVVVGVDGSPNSAGAIEFAFEEASARGTHLTAVYAWVVPPTSNLGPITRWHYDPVQAQQEAERVLAEALAGWPDKYPDVEVLHRAVHSMNPVRDLIEESADAELVVVGARGRGGLANLLGSVSDGLVRHARVPVAVVHPRS